MSVSEVFSKFDPLDPLEMQVWWTYVLASKKEIGCETYAGDENEEKKDGEIVLAPLQLQQRMKAEKKASPFT